MLDPFVPYPAIGSHGLVGDRRTAALIAADGTVDWLCAPDFDDEPLLAALIDAQHGGLLRVGPRRRSSGTQRYLDDSAVLVTTFGVDSGELELADAFAWDDDEAGPRALLRRVRCRGGTVHAALEWRPRRAARLETSLPRDGASFEMHAGEEAWVILPLDDAEWDEARARSAWDKTLSAWQRWAARLSVLDAATKRSAITIHLLGYAPEGSMVAAPTCSLPERIGGDRNYDYRYAWVRDASLCIGSYARIGDRKTASRFLDWLAGLGSSTDAPLQPVYGLRGELHLEEREDELVGYRGSAPVRFGNRAYAQRQNGSFGFLADAMHRVSPELRTPHAALLARVADHTCSVWRRPDAGIWELPEERHYVSSKIMCWVALDRALALEVSDAAQRRRWATERTAIRDDVLARGFSERLGAFREHYDADTLDGAALLLPVMGFLPADDPRIRSTIDRLLDELSIDGLLYRWSPRRGEGAKDIGQLEGAFVPLVFWLATALASAERFDEAHRVLVRGESLANRLGLFAEEHDPRDGTALGNFPLLFSHSEHLRAKEALGLVPKISESARPSTRPAPTTGAPRSRAKRRS